MMKLVSVLIACALAAGTYAVAAPDAQLPEGWTLGGEAPKLYGASVDQSDSPSHKGSVELHRTETSHPFGSAMLTKRFPAAVYGGKQFRLRIYAKFEGEHHGDDIAVVTDKGTWVSGQGSKAGWHWIECDVTLPSGITKLEIGVSRKGPGSAKVDQIELQPIGDAPANQQGVSLKFVALPAPRQDQAAA